MVADRHHGDDLLAVEEQGQRPLVDDRGLDRAALLVDAGDRLGQARIVRVGQQQGLAQGGARPFLCGVSSASVRLGHPCARCRGRSRIGPTCPPSVRRPIPPPPRRGALAPRCWAGCRRCCLVGLVAWVVLFFAMAPKLPDTARAVRARASRPRSRCWRPTARRSRCAAAAARASCRSTRSRPGWSQAVIATEDRRFRHHFGIDPVGLARALVDNLRAGGVVAGGSTITQQLAKNLYLTPERSLTPQAAGADAGDLARDPARQGPDPRPLPQPGLSGCRRLRRGGGVAALFRQAARTT